MPLKYNSSMWIMQEKDPIWEVLEKIRVCEKVIRKSCKENTDETTENLFIECPLANRLWCRFSTKTVVNCPLLKLKDSLMKR